MEGGVAASCHTLDAAFVPKAVRPCHVVGTVGGFVAAAGAYEVGEAVVVGSTRAACFRGLEIAEAAPGDGDVVGVAAIVEVAVATVLEVAMVDPAIGYAVETEIVVTIAVVGTWTYER